MTIPADVERGWASVLDRIGEDIALPDGTKIKAVWSGVSELTDTSVRGAVFRLKTRTTEAKTLGRGALLRRVSDDSVVRVLDNVPDRFGHTWLIVQRGPATVRKD